MPNPDRRSGVLFIFSKQPSQGVGDRIPQTLAFSLPANRPEDEKDAVNTIDIPPVTETADTADFPNAADTTDTFDAADAFDAAGTADFPNAAGTAGISNTSDTADAADRTDGTDTGPVGAARTGDIHRMASSADRAGTMPHCRILFIGDEVLPEHSCAFLTLAEELTARGCFVLLASPAEDRFLPAHLPHVFIPSHRSSPAAQADCLRTLKPLLKKHRIEILQGFGPRAASLARALASFPVPREPAKKEAASPRSAAGRGNFSTPPTVVSYYDRTCTFSSGKRPVYGGEAVLVAGEDIRDRLLDHWAFPYEAVRLIPEGIRPRPSRAPEAHPYRPRLLCQAPLTREGAYLPFLLLELAGDLNRRFGATLTLLGEGEMRPKIAEKVREVNRIHGCVAQLGEGTPEEHLPHHTVFLGSDRGARLAMAEGLPLILCNRQGLWDFFEGSGKKTPEAVTLSAPKTDPAAVPGMASVFRSFPDPLKSADFPESADFPGSSSSPESVSVSVSASVSALHRAWEQGLCPPATGTVTKQALWEALIHLITASPAHREAFSREEQAIIQQKASPAGAGRAAMALYEKLLPAVRQKCAKTLLLADTVERNSPSSSLISLLAAEEGAFTLLGRTPQTGKKPWGGRGKTIEKSAGGLLPPGVTFIDRRRHPFQALKALWGARHVVVSPDCVRGGYTKGAMTDPDGMTILTGGGSSPGYAPDSGDDGTFRKAEAFRNAGVSGTADAALNPMAPGKETRSRQKRQAQEIRHPSKARPKTHAWVRLAALLGKPLAYWNLPLLFYPDRVPADKDRPATHKESLRRAKAQPLVAALPGKQKTVAFRLPSASLASLLCAGQVQRVAGGNFQLTRLPEQGKLYLRTASGKESAGITPCDASRTASLTAPLQGQPFLLLSPWLLLPRARTGTADATEGCIRRKAASHSAAASCVADLLAFFCEMGYRCGFLWVAGQEKEKKRLMAGCDKRKIPRPLFWQASQEEALSLSRQAACVLVCRKEELWLGELTNVPLLPVSDDPEVHTLARRLRVGYAGDSCPDATVSCAGGVSLPLQGVPKGELNARLSRIKENFLMALASARRPRGAAAPAAGCGSVADYEVIAGSGVLAESDAVPGRDTTVCDTTACNTTACNTTACDTCPTVCNTATGSNREEAEAGTDPASLWQKIRADFVAFDRQTALRICRKRRKHPPLDKSAPTNGRKRKPKKTKEVLLPEGGEPAVD